MKVQKIIFILIIILVSLPFVLGQQKVTNKDCQIPFELKYEKSGIMFLLLEPQYFEARKLKSLFGCLSQKHSKLAYLRITALSDKEQLDRLVKSFIKDLTSFPTHPPTIFYPKGWKPTPPPPPSYYRANYYHYKNEYFEFSPNPQKWEMTTVVLNNKELKKKRR